MAVSNDFHDLIHRLLETRLDELSEDERQGFIALAKRFSVARDVGADYEARQSFGERLADRVASFGGSWTFIMLFGGTLTAWVIANTVILAADRAFDPYPFIFLNLILSMIAAVQAPIIMMSQNRQAERDRLAAANDYDVNIKAEIEIMALHEKLDRMRLAELSDMVRSQGQDLSALCRRLEGTLPAGESPPSFPGPQAS
jgi:uncharacterized membrane protein